MKGKKDFDDVRRRAEKQGWTVTRRANNHLLWISPSGERVYSSGTPSNGSALLQHLRVMRRYGYQEES